MKNRSKPSVKTPGPRLVLDLNKPLDLLISLLRRRGSEIWTLKRVAVAAMPELKVDAAVRKLRRYRQDGRVKDLHVAKRLADLLSKGSGASDIRVTELELMEGKLGER